MNTLVENMTGMNTMTDQVIAQDMLLAAKAGIKNYALALTETTSPEVRNVLRKHMEDAITAHENISTYMVNKGWYKAYDFMGQIEMNIQNAQTALQNANTQQQ